MQKEGKNDLDFELNSNTRKSNTPALFKRARAKYFTYGLLFNLLKLDSPLRKQYWNTYHCASTLEQTGNKITGKYCKNRFCLVCNRIRTAQLIKQYAPIISKWEDKYFVTLTIVNVKAELLEETIDGMLKNSTNIVNVIKKRRKCEFLALRKLEGTYNAPCDDYHPHFHFIVKGKEAAELLRSEWLKRYPTSLEGLQNIKPCDNDTMMEMFKYFTKVMSSSSKSIGGVSKEYKRKIYVNALDNIFQSVSGRRTFQTYGFKIVPEIADETIELKDIENIVSEKYNWEWTKELSDWIRYDTGELLTGYEPSKRMQELITDSIVIKQVNKYDF